MNIKKLLSILMALTLLISMIPTTVLAQPSVIFIEGPKVECIRTKAVTATPALSSGNHPSYLDRVAELPDYALEYYHWLEDNAWVGGALVDPTTATEYDGEYYHCVTFVSGTESFTFSSKEEMLATGGEIAAAALDREFSAFSTWASVVEDIFDREHPEVFWLSGRSSNSYLANWTYTTRGNVCTVIYQAEMVVWLSYPDFDIRNAKYQDPEAVAAAINVRDEEVREILSDCPEGSDYDRVVYLNDTLTARNAYNSAVASGKSSQADAESWECISALVGNAGSAGPVCEGYARAFQVLCNELEIPCVLVDGEAISNVGDRPESHMWNYVQLDGGWYAVDVTWNDPYVSSDPEQKQTGRENHDWLLLGSDTQVAPGLTFLESHAVDNRIRPQGLAYTNGPVLEREAYDPDAAVTYTVSGTVTCKGGTGAVTVQLWQESTLVASQTVDGSSVTYTFEGIVPGPYQLTVSKSGCVTRSEELMVTDQAVSQDSKLCVPGDVSGDGRINVGDVSRIYGHIKKKVIITDPYALLCADYTGDGRLNVGDTARVYALIRR